MALKPQASASDDSHWGDESGGEIISEINITPLVDVFLVLLIIFMVTSSVLSQMGVDVQLPSASQQLAQTQPDGVIVTLLPSGGLRVSGAGPGAEVAPGRVAELGPALKRAFTQTKSRLVVLEGDQKAFLGSVIEVLDVARKAGADRFAIATAAAR